MSPGSDMFRGIGSHQSNQPTRLPSAQSQNQQPAKTVSTDQNAASQGVELSLSNLSDEELNQVMLQASQEYKLAKLRDDQQGADSALLKLTNLRNLGATASVSLPPEQVPTPPGTATSPTRQGIGTSEEGHAVFRDRRDGSVIFVSNEGQAEVLVGPKRPNVELQNFIVESCKVKYFRANLLGDAKTKNEAMRHAEMARQQGATISPEEDTALTRALKRYDSPSGGAVKTALDTRTVQNLNLDIVKLKNDYQYAQKINDSVGMEAARVMGDILRRMGGTIGSEVSLEEARKIVSSPTPPPPPANTSEPQRDSMFDHALGIATGAVKIGGQTALSIVQAGADPFGAFCRLIHQGVVGAYNAVTAAIDYEQTLDEIDALLGQAYQYYQNADDYEKGKLEGELLATVFTTILAERGIKIRNGKLAGSTHPASGVPFDLHGFPIFDPKHEVHIDKGLHTAGYETHRKKANEMLRMEIEANPEFANAFTAEQLSDIRANKTPRGYVWHHHQDVGRMQLVDSDLHEATGHTGGMSIWGK